MRFGKKTGTAGLVTLLLMFGGASFASPPDVYKSDIIAHYSQQGYKITLGIANITVEGILCGNREHPNKCDHPLTGKKGWIKIGSVTMVSFTTDEKGRFSEYMTGVPFNPSTKMGPTIVVDYAGDATSTPTSTSIPPMKGF